VTIFELLAVVITVTAVLGFANQRWLRLPTVIGVTIAGLVTSVGVLALGASGLVGGGAEFAEDILARIDFDALLMQGMLGALLFAGALEVDVGELWRQKWTILVLATAGVIASTFLVGGAVYLTLQALGLSIDFVWALLFGALISPTDPIAVLALLKRAHAPRELETLIGGESLFNDGVGVVVFALILSIATAAGGGDALPAAEAADAVAHGGGLGAGDIAVLFLEEAGGGILFGLALGFTAYWMLKEIDAYGIEILVTLAVVTGGYALAGRLHVSGPLAMVVAGLLIGNRGRALAMSETTKQHLGIFWVVVDEVLNAILFVLIGLEVLVLEPSPLALAAGALAIPIVLAARFASVGAPIHVLRRRRRFRRYTVRIMTWGGLRGGIAIALALSIPPVPQRDLILLMTYVVVVFSIIAQGLTVEPLARRAMDADREADDLPTAEEVALERAVQAGAGAPGAPGEA
jgi:CPA1 family monovalent cation:H+ antiporter